MVEIRLSEASSNACYDSAHLTYLENHLNHLCTLGCHSNLSSGGQNISSSPGQDAAIWPDLDWSGHSPGGAGHGFYRFLVQIILLIPPHLPPLFVNTGTGYLSNQLNINFISRLLRGRRRVYLGLTTTDHQRRSSRHSSQTQLLTRMTPCPPVMKGTAVTRVWRTMRIRGRFTAPRSRPGPPSSTPQALTPPSSE